MILLNEIIVYHDTFVDGNLMLDFISDYEKRSKSYAYKTPFIKWLREENDYRVFACMYYLLRYFHRTKVKNVKLNIFERRDLSSRLNQPPCLGFGPLKSNCDWKIAKWHIEDDPEYTGNYTVYCHELEANWCSTV